MRLLAFFLGATMLSANCIPVEGDRILASHLASRVPEFAKVAGEETIGFAPAPTVRRIMGSGELVRLGHKFGIEIAAPVDLCFESPTEVLTRDKILDEIKASLAMDDVEIELIEFSRYPVPIGVLSFPRAGLNVHPLLTDQSIVFWRGKVSYGGTRSYAVWARLRMSTSKERLVATESIPSGAVLTENQVRMERVKQFPLQDRAPLTAADVVGKIARRIIPAGQILTAASIAPLKEVTRGAEVAVVVKSQGAQLSLPARAETSGAIGETVSLKNPVNGRSFRGVVDGKNQVTVTAK